MKSAKKIQIKFYSDPKQNNIETKDQTSNQC